MKIQQKALSVFVLLYLIINAGLLGQYNSTTYFMKNLPQSSLMNPAFQPGCNFYLALPGISMDISNSAINYNNLIKYNAEIDSFYTPFNVMATDMEREGFINLFDDINTISTSFNFNIFNLGFRVGESFYSFHIAERFNSNFDYPKDLIKLLVQGNGDAGIYDFSGFGVKINAFQEIGLSVSSKLSNSVTFGVRGKLLFGQFDLSMSDQNIVFDVDTFGIDVTSTFSLNGSSPFHEVVVTDGKFDSIQGNGIQGDELVSALLARQNLGFGFDLGVNYDAGNRLSLSAGLLDLGIITWKNNVFNLSNDSANFSFEGIEWKIGQSNKSEDDTLSFFGSLADSVKNQFNINGTAEPYTTFLTGKILLGFNYKLLDGFDIGILSYTEIYRKKIIPRLTISANFRPVRFLNASFSYSLLNDEFYNLGFGLSFKPGPFNWYVIGDTFPMVLTSGTPIPVYSKSFRIQAGFNFVFGNVKKKQMERDLPLWF